MIAIDSCHPHLITLARRFRRLPVLNKLGTRRVIPKAGVNNPGGFGSGDRPHRGTIGTQLISGPRTRVRKLTTHVSLEQAASKFDLTNPRSL